MAHLMIVEDDDATRKMMANFLRYKNYDVIEARNGSEALDKLKNENADVILMDVSMPKIDGIEATKKIRERGIPSIVVILTALSDKETVKKAAQAGADDFLSKPINFSMMETRIRLALKASGFYQYKATIENRLHGKLRIAEKDLEDLMEKNFQIGFEMLNIMNKISEFRDDETHEHTFRVGWLSGRMAEQMGLSSSFVTRIQFAAPLHDLGKIGIPDKILLKPEKLTNEEWKIMKKHSKIGYDIMSKSSSGIIKLASNIALSHHERWDGSGYPQRLKAEEIPLSSLIVAIADSFDAMASKRPYKEAIPLQDVYGEIVANSGKLYSPRVVKAFISLKEEIFARYNGNAKTTF